MSLGAPQGDLDWRVARACDGGACIRVARRGETVLIGNTNEPEGPVSEFTLQEWHQFLTGIKLGDFDGMLDMLGQELRSAGLADKASPHL